MSIGFERRFEELSPFKFLVKCRKALVKLYDHLAKMHLQQLISWNLEIH